VVELTRQVIIEGVGLHTGACARVVLRACDGPVRLSVNGVETRIDQLEVVSTARATSVEAHATRIHTVEHALAAFAGLGVYEGVCAEIDGPEMPLLDGGASRWCQALESLGVAPSLPRLRVATEAVIDVGPSRYELMPSEQVGVAVALDFDDPRIARHASWDGDRDDFRVRIAPARTFVFSRDVEELLRRGLARHVDPSAVVVIASDTVHHVGRPFAADEPARHKLLDLVGDLYLRGGPPLGRVRAFRPGHAANARAIALAFERGHFTQS
jgi:UDP-3-O-[3-hydroxymyristoyl] N-acetylglucosamine deacetylase